MKKIYLILQIIILPQFLFAGSVNVKHLEKSKSTISHHETKNEKQLNNNNDIEESDLEQHQFIVGIAVNRSDGGDVAMLEDFDFKDKDGEKRSANALDTFPIEEVLLALYHVNARYVKPDKKDDSEMGIVGQIEFLEPHEFSEHFKVGIGKHKRMKINEFVLKLAKIDKRWKAPGEIEKKHYHFFQPLFNGHVMVPISLDMGNDETVEVARFHFNVNGLNMWRKQRRVNFIYNHGKPSKDEGNMPQVIRRRSHYYPENFSPNPLKTKLLSIKNLLDIAVRIVEGKGWKIREYNCMHFAFEFILTIAENPENLEKISSWPTELVKLEKYAYNVDQIDPLGNSLNLWRTKSKYWLTGTVAHTNTKIP